MKSSIAVTLAVIGIFGAATAAAADDKIVWVEYPESGVVLGQGYDLLEDRPATGTCVDFVPVQDPSQSMQYRFDEVTSNTQVQSVTNISASGSMKMAVLKATAKLSFLSDEKFKLETQKFLLSANVINSALFAAPSVDFKKGGEVVGGKTKENPAGKDYSDSSKMVLKSDASIFDAERCGQGYVGAIVSGASLDAFLTMSKSDAESLADIKGSLEADIGGIFQVSGSFGQKQTSSSIQQNTSVSVFKTGGQGSQIAYDLAGLKAAVAAMPLEAATTPKPIKIAIVPYQMLDKIPSQQTYSAELFSQAVAAYFLVSDVFQNTGSAIDSYQKFSEAATAKQPLFRKDLHTYVDLNGRAMKSANQLSQILVMCQAAMVKANKSLNDSDAKSNAAHAQLLATKVGVDPEHEKRPPWLRAVTMAQGSSVDEKFIDAVRVLTTSVAAGQTDDDTKQLRECGSNEPGTFLGLAIDDAISLAAEELSDRPIYWADLDIYQKEMLRPIAAEVGLTKTVAELTKEAAPILTTYSADYRTQKMLRDICGKSFAHPICGVNIASFVTSAAPKIVEGDFKPLQLAQDVMNEEKTAGTSTP